MSDRRRRAMKATNTSVKSSVVKVSVEPDVDQNEVTQMTTAEHTKEKSMWAGCKEIGTTSDWVVIQDEEGNIGVKNITRQHSKAVVHFSKELMGNAADHCNSYPPGVVSAIDLHWESGISEGFSILNTGPGFKLDKKMKLKDGTEVWTPEACATIIGVGKNLKGGNSNIGTNGAGLAVVVGNCKQTVLDTVYVEKGNKPIFYRQIYSGLGEDKNLVIGVPDLKADPATICNKIHKGGTKISAFVDWSDYVIENSKGKVTDHPDANCQYFKSLRLDMQTIASETKIYLDYLRSFEPIRRRKVPLMTVNWDLSNGSYTGVEVALDIDFKTFMSGVCVSSSDIIINGTMADNKYKNEIAWKIYLGVAVAKVNRFSIVNGVRVIAGSHINKTLDRVAKWILTKLDKKHVNKLAAVKAVLNVGIVGCVFDPSFDGQTKNRIDAPESRWAHHDISENDLKAFWVVAKVDIMDKLYGKSTGKTKAAPVEHIKAKNRHVKGSNCRLYVPEGNSAMSAFKIAIASNKLEGFTQDTNGGYDIRGVPINVLENTTENSKGDRLPNKKVQDNVKMAGLFNLMELVPGVDYSDNTNFNKLPYKELAPFVDQDHDGIGKIMPMIILAIHTIWPELAARPGFFVWLPTPIVRVYKSKTDTSAAHTFYNLERFNEWDKLQIAGNQKYYKGLGSHDENRGEVTGMFLLPIRTLVMDARAPHYLQRYYGATSDERKVLMRQPNPTSQEICDDIGEGCPSAAEMDDMTSGGFLPITYVLRVFTHEYMKDTLNRALPGVGSGLQEGKRKIVATTSVLSKDNAIKITAVTGKVMDVMGYAHGDGAASKTVTSMCKAGPNCSNQVVLLRAGGNCGTAVEGYTDAAEPRYLSVYPNGDLTSVLFPQVDNVLFPHASEGKSVFEPQYNSSVLPYVLMNYINIPANGWKITLYGRTWKSLRDRTLWYIAKRSKDATEGINHKQTIAQLTDANLPDVPGMPPYMHMYNYKPGSTLECLGGKLYSVGKYIVNSAKNTVLVTELPFETNPSAYAKTMMLKNGKGKGKDGKGPAKKKIIKDVDIDVAECSCLVYFEPGVLQLLLTAPNKGVRTALEVFLNVHKAVNSCLNMMHKGVLAELKTYEEVFSLWYSTRHDTYLNRVAYLKRMYHWQIIRITEQQRYAGEYTRINKSLDDEPIEMSLIISRLIEDKYIQLNNARVTAPGIVAPEQIDTVVSGGASYDYLTNMTVSQMTKKGRATRDETLLDLRAKLKEVNNPNYLWTTWKKEIAAVSGVLEIGVESYWKYTTEAGRARGEKSDGKKKPRKSKKAAVKPAEVVTKIVAKRRR